MGPQQDTTKSFAMLNDLHTMYQAFFDKFWRKDINLRDSPTFSHLQLRLQEDIKLNVIKGIEGTRAIHMDDTFFGMAFTVFTIDEWNHLKNNMRWDIKRGEWLTLTFHANPRHALEHLSWMESSRHKKHYTISTRYVIVGTMFSKREWLLKCVMNPKYYKVKQYGYGLHETDYAIELRTDISQTINGDQWDRTIAHSFTRNPWYCSSNGRMYEGLGGLRDQNLQRSVFNTYHMTYSTCYNRHGQPFATPSDMTIIHLITRYELPLFIMLGAYHPNPPEFIRKFRGVIRDKLIGEIEVFITWPILQMDAACHCFTTILEYEVETMRDQDEINHYHDYKKKIMERS